MACHALHDAEPLGARRSSTPSPDAISDAIPRRFQTVPADVTTRLHLKILCKAVYRHSRVMRPKSAGFAPVTGEFRGPGATGALRGRPFGTRSCPSRRQAPTASRSARIPGSPASWLSRWAAAMSYSHRIIVNVNPSVSRIAKLARGSASRGWPTEPGLQI